MNSRRDFQRPNCRDMHRNHTSKVNDFIKGLRIVYAIRRKTPNHGIFFKRKGRVSKQGYLISKS
jgi:hypothetical protein